MSRESVAKIILRYGISAIVLIDQGANFLREMFKNVCKPLKINKIESTAYHPESKIGIERSHRVVPEYVKHTGEELRNWGHWIPFIHNITEHVSTGYSVFKLVFGYKPRLPSALSDPSILRYNYEDYVLQLTN